MTAASTAPYRKSTYRVPIRMATSSVLPIFPIKPATSKTAGEGNQSRFQENSTLKRVLYQDGSVVNIISAHRVSTITTTAVPPPNASSCSVTTHAPLTFNEMLKLPFFKHQPQQHIQSNPDPISFPKGTVQTTSITTVRLFRPQLTTLEQEMQDLLGSSGMLPHTDQLQGYVNAHRRRYELSAPQIPTPQISTPMHMSRHVYGYYQIVAVVKIPVIIGDQVVRSSTRVQRSASCRDVSLVY